MHFPCISGNSQNCLHNPASLHEHRIGGVRNNTQSRLPRRRLDFARLSILLCRTLARALFAIALACKSGLYPLLLARFQIERVSLDFPDDVLLQDFALEATQRVFQSFTILDVDLGQ